VANLERGYYTTLERMNAIYVELLTLRSSIFIYKGEITT